MGPAHSGTDRCAARIAGPAAPAGDLHRRSLSRCTRNRPRRTARATEFSPSTEPVQHRSTCTARLHLLPRMGRASGCQVTSRDCRCRGSRTAIASWPWSRRRASIAVRSASCRPQTCSCATSIFFPKPLRSTRCWWVSFPGLRHRSVTLGVKPRNPGHRRDALRRWNPHLSASRSSCSLQNPVSRLDRSSSPRHQTLRDGGLTHNA